MVLRVIEVAASQFFPSQYLVHAIIGLLSVLVFRAFSQGRVTDRERDLHARVILVTGGFTPLGVTILQQLAQRGAHIVALSPYPIDSENVTILINLLRTTTNNEQIFAEECNLVSPGSIRSFCTRFLTEKEQRLDAIIFAHEYRHIGSPAFLSGISPTTQEKEREGRSLATFLITTLLLPALLVAPVERDIRIINVVNPFYAAAAGLPFSPYTHSTSKAKSIFLAEGTRSLRTIVYTRHLQRVLDALPSAAQVPKTEEGSTAVPVVKSNLQKSNIIAVSVSPGIGRQDTISPLLNADWTSRSGTSYVGVLVYLLSQPLLRIFTKSSSSAMQTVLHTLFLPTPYKILSQTTFTSSNSAKAKEGTTSVPPPDTSQLEMPEEVLRPGVLYADCAVVKLKVELSQELVENENARIQATPPSDTSSKSKSKGKGKEEESEKPSLQGALDIPDDDEYGGELAGRLVWEALEQALKAWEKENSSPPPETDVRTRAEPPSEQMERVVEEKKEDDYY